MAVNAVTSRFKAASRTRSSLTRICHEPPVQVIPIENLPRVQTRDSESTAPLLNPD
ncbi:MAG: hypothetical protein HC933_18490 [Pleurocapsa sp. SU_196_0]|nr:hypothetical protein [Pleurocapsa sp. SU_196_0]